MSEKPIKSEEYSKVRVKLSGVYILIGATIFVVLGIIAKIYYSKANDDIWMWFAVLTLLMFFAFWKSWQFRKA